MNSKRLYFGLLGIIGLLIMLLLGGAYGADALLSAQSKTLVDKRLQVAVLESEQQQLTHAKQDIQKYQDLATIAKSVVPQDKDQVQTVRQIAALASQYHISLLSITFPSSTLGGTAGHASKPELSQLLPVTGVPGVYNLQISVESDTTKPVPYSQFIRFLSALEHNRRTAEVTSISIVPNSNDRSTLSFSLVLDEYIKP